MKFKIFSFGCKVNQYESEYIRQIMCDDGHEYTEKNSDSEIFIVNSCSVTAVSDSKCRKLLHKLRREKPDSIILLCGCMSQAFPRKYENFTDCDIVTGNTKRSAIPQYISKFITERKTIIDIEEHDRKNECFESAIVSDFSERTRAFLKIEDGCDRFCSYCIIPYARGRIRSKTLEYLQNEVNILAHNGYKEIVLVGINLSNYGIDLGLNLCDAIECVENTDGVERIRLGSLEPELLDEDLVIRMSKCKKLCPQFHLSLQSGCNDTLQRMNRRYTSDEYKVIVQRLRKYFVNCSITTDVMVGFPGETEEEFNSSLSFVSDINFAKVHVFPYSRRSGTVADRMPNQLQKSEKERRAKIMTDECESCRQEFLSSQVGKTCSVLFERFDKNGMAEGYTENYTPIVVDTDRTDLFGNCISVKITAVSGDKCIGELLDN